MLAIDRFLIVISRACFAGFQCVASWMDGIRVSDVSTERVKDILNAGRTPQPAGSMAQDQAASEFVIVDVRSEAETAVSMIPGAITKAHFEAERTAYRDCTVIAYCTIGGRSLMYARKLARQGVDVLNYRDSIIGWCRSELPLCTPQGQPTTCVHVYCRIFSVPEAYEATTESD